MLLGRSGRRETARNARGRDARRGDGLWSYLYRYLAPSRSHTPKQKVAVVVVAAAAATVVAMTAARPAVRRSRSSLSKEARERLPPLRRNESTNQRTNGRTDRRTDEGTRLAVEAETYEGN